METLEEQIVVVKFECRFKDEGECSPKLRKGPFSGLACTKHMNEHADELGVYPQEDRDPAAPPEGRGPDWNRRHPKPRRKA